MLTGLIEGHVTRLATPPESRSNIQFSIKGEDPGIVHHHAHRRPRPPPAPRPRTLEGSELVGRRHSRVCSPSSSSSSCIHHHHRRRPHHHHRPHSRACCCEEEEEEEDEEDAPQEDFEDSCDERLHSHRHSYHEGLHNAHLLSPLRLQHSIGGGRRSASPCHCPTCVPPQRGSLTDLTEQCGGGRRRRRPLLPPPMGLSFGGSKNVEDRLSQLEGDKESLQLQVSVLTEQVDAQTEKIHDLENLLEQKKALLQRNEEQLQKELMARSTLETQRLELLSEISNLKLRQAATERENLDLRDKLRLNEISFDHNRSQTPPPNARRKIDQFGTIPRQQRDLIAGHMTSPGGTHLSATTGRSPKGVMFGKGFNSAFLALKGSEKRSTSAPNLAETEKLGNECATDNSYSPPQEIKSDIPLKGTAAVAPLSSHRSPSIGHKPTGIKKIFTRLRRSSSGHIENDVTDNNDLKRGGLRATATARLGWTSQTGLFREPQLPFSSWSSKHIEEWLSAMGLSQYCAAAKCWMETGNHISQASLHQLEKDIGVRHPLHRKKLHLAISNRMSVNNLLNKSCGKLDSAWVLRWLDDLGLPQYKDVFNDSRIDGLVLNYLTYDDLAFLRISNLLHVTSLKRGIQVLREHNFDPSVLKRRSSPEEEKQPPTPAEVALWTNHRVMEWLKTVDLSEYAPNLRGSGVHGALMVYEIKFTSEFLASLLSISSSKTLLRRHLSTHFKELVGKEVVQAKRELQVSPGYIPLTTTAKVKMPKKSQFSLKRRKAKNELEFDDLICPLDEVPPKLPHSVDSNIKENPVDAK